MVTAGVYFGLHDMESDLQLFRLSPEIWKSANFDDVMDTFEDMGEMGIAISPFTQFAIEVKVKFAKGMTGAFEVIPKSIEDCTILVEYWMERQPDPLHPEAPKNILVTMINDDGRILASKINLASLFHNKAFGKFGTMPKGAAEDLMHLCHDLRAVLIVMLATRNTKQETIVNRNLLAGKSNKKNEYRKGYPYTTTISIGKITESEIKDGDDPRHVRPHLRRGHIRTQRYGPDRSFEKKIFIEPVFVNASEGWIAKRQAYNVSSKAWPDSRANA